MAADTTEWERLLHSVDNAPLDPDNDTYAVRKTLGAVAAKWRPVGEGLGLAGGKLDVIGKNNSGDSLDCMGEVAREWLKRNYNTSKFGKPTWRKLAEVVADPVGGGNFAHARKIANEHLISIQDPEGAGDAKGKSFQTVESKGREQLAPKTELGEQNQAELQALKAELRKQRMLNMCSCIAPGPPDVYKLPLQEVFKKPGKDDPNIGVAKYHISLSRSHRPPASKKVVLVVGATGAGKSTLINGMANYILGVRWEDDYRLKLITDEGSMSQAHSQTTWFTAYTFHPMEGSRIPFTLTVIDTPGFGDMRRDKLIARQFKELFSTGRDGIDQLDGIAFVTQAFMARLVPTQKYIFDSILAIFGKDLASNIFVMTTFTDGRVPPVLAAIEGAKIPYHKSFKFNNSALYAEDEEDDVSFDKMFWDMNVKSFSAFFSHLQTVEPKSLQLTREILQEREQLETVILGLMPQVRAGLSKIDELRQEELVLERHEAEKLQNKLFYYEVRTISQRKVDLPPGMCATNCLQCNDTCHYPCRDRDTSKCQAMQSGYCTVCRGSCHWKRHVQNHYRIETYEAGELRFFEDLKKRYDQAQSGKTQVESVIATLRADLEQLHKQVSDKTRQAQQSLKRLNEIVLKPDPLSDVEYIDGLIESEKQQAMPGWRERVEYLQESRQQAQIVSTANT